MLYKAGRVLTRLATGLLLPGLIGCSTTAPAPVKQRTQENPATSAKPVTERTPQIAASSNGMHRVQRGETLYAIAFANGLDHRDVARWNRLESVDRILVGQTLRLTPPPGAVEIQALDDTPAPHAQALAEHTVLREPQAVLLPYSDARWAQVTGAASSKAAATPSPAPVAIAPAAVPPASAPSPARPVAAASVENWQWPAAGTLAGRFGAAGGKGIDIVGQRNAPIQAVAPGKVVYSGSGLRGYGRLLIVKHAGEFLSAYAHNESLLVKEGDAVTAGQHIALMGDSDSDRVKLHFEIRRYGKPLDPLDYLPERT